MKEPPMNVSSCFTCLNGGANHQPEKEKEVDHEREIQ